MKAAIWALVLGYSLALVSVPLTTISPHDADWLPLEIDRMRGSGTHKNMRVIDSPRSYHLANVTIGFPPKVYEMEIDVTMAGCWITSESCESLGCYPKTGYNSSESILHRPKGDVVKIQYGGGRGHGKLSSDTISIGGLHVISFLFSEIEHLAGGAIIKSPYDGVLGAQWSGGNETPDNLFSALFARGLIPTNSFSVSLSGNKGHQLVLGGVNPELSLFAFSYYPLLDIAPWTVQAQALLVAGQQVNLTAPTLKIDLTVPYFQGSAALINQINSAIGPIAANCTDIETLPSVVLDLGHNEYTISPEMYVVQTTSDSGKRCFSGFLGVNMAQGLEETLVVGDSFVRKYYAHFDLGNKQLGFAFSA